VYAVFGIGLESDMAGGVIPLNGLDQSQDARVDQVFKKNIGWKPIMNSLRDVLDLGELFEQQALALR
jgi:methylmalonyl-CoA mutase cobalamin-binding subunit